MNSLSNIHYTYLYTGNSGMNNDHIIRGRPYGGTAILFKKSLSRFITPITCNSKRISGIKVVTGLFSCVILSVYLPCDSFSNHIDPVYAETISCIETIYNSIDCNSFIVCGDFNTSFSRDNAQTKYLKDFIIRNHLCNGWDHSKSVIDFTYNNLHLNHMSCIDHFIVTKNLFQSFTNMYILHESINVSSHSAVILSIDGFNYCPTIIKRSNITVSSNCNWKRASPAHLLNYTQCLNKSLEQIEMPTHLLNCDNINCCNSTHTQAIEQLSTAIVKCCIDSGTECIPMTKPSDRTVTGWNDYVKHDKDQSLFWHWIWLEAGRPNKGHVYAIMQRTRHLYHYSVRRCKQQKLQIQRTKLAENINESEIFWEEVNKITSASKQTSNTIGNAHGPHEITTLFHDKYKALYNSVPTNDREMSELYANVRSKVLECDLSILHDVTPCLIQRCIKKLKSGKGDGGEGFKSDHLINSCTRLHVLLSILFRSIVMHGYSPRNLLVSTIVSIPKDSKASLCNQDNYRGISLFNSIAKVFDYVIIDLFGDHLMTSDMQFAYKEKHSTTLCSVIYLETLQHYAKNGSSVFSCLLDASKAFDRIHYGKLFNILLHKDIPVFIIRYLLDCYTRQESRVLWDSCHSEYFSMSNGVKQGGVLSAMLFTIYVDKLLIRLKDSKIGCHINGCYTGA